MELDDLMKDCLIKAHKQCNDFGYIDTVMAAFPIYVDLRGGPIEFVDDQEAEEYLQRCVYFLVDCVVVDMIEKGIIEVESIDEDGDLMYKMSAEF